MLNIAHEIDKHIANKTPFVVYRMPYEKDVHFVNNGNFEIINDLSLLDIEKHNGFVISPFTEKSSLPIVFIPNEKQNDTSQHTTVTDHVRPTHDMSFDEYTDVLQQYKTALTSGHIDKLVLSRSATTTREKNTSLGTIFIKAITQYPRMMVYLCQTPPTGIWIGCSPEILLEGSKGCWQTVALAGTQPYSDNVSWDNKNTNEQHYVEMFIENTISQIGRIVDKQGPYTSRAGHLAHLRTDYFFSTPDNVSLGSIIKRLHPTPAVCGLPQKEALSLIENIEPTDRQYYSGIVGIIGKKSRLFVNLRCAKVNDTDIICYAGGGIMPTSEPDSEWWETEAKMATLKSLLNHEQ